MLEIHQHSWDLLSLLFYFSRLSLTSEVKVFEFSIGPILSFLFIRCLLPIQWARVDKTQPCILSTDFCMTGFSMPCLPGSNHLMG